MYELSTLHPNGLFLRREAMEFGYRDRDLAEARRARVLVRVRHGAYVAADTWHRADDVGRHRLRAQAVCLTHGSRVALSHTSAAAEHGLRLWSADLDTVHVLRLDNKSGGHLSGVVYHEGRWTPDEILAKDELLLVEPERCALEAASLLDVERGLVITDSVLDLGLGSLESMWSTYSAQMSHSPHCAKLQITLRLTRPGSQSVGETRGRHMCWAQHLPEPELQFHVYDDFGHLVGITDFAWPELHLLGEFDGKVKYGRLLRAGQEPGDVVFEEKRREDRLREVTQWAVIRFVWAELNNPRACAERMRRLMRRAQLL